MTFVSAAQLDFGKDVKPIFDKKCAACHCQLQSKGDLKLETYEEVLKGGKDGPVIVKGKSDQSLLYMLASGKDDPEMPPRKNKVNAQPMTNDELAVIKRWIDEGAAGSMLATDAPVHWQPLPNSFNPIDAVAISPDGQYASCARANHIFVYNLASGTLVGRLSDPQADHDMVLSLAFSADGRILASGGYRCVKLWKRENVAPVLTLASDSADAGLAAASPDGEWLAASGPENHIRVFDAATGKLAHDIPGHTGAVRALQFSPDSSRLVSGSADKTIHIWDIAGKELGKIPAPAEVNAVTWLADGKRLAAGCADNLIRVFASADGKEWKPGKELKGHSAPPASLCALLNSQILSGSADGSVRVWDCDGGNEVRKMDNGAPVVAVAAQNDGKRFASAGANFAKIWKAENAQLLFTLKGDRRAYDALADAERNVAFAKDQVAYFKTATQDAEKTLTTETEVLKKAEEKARSTAADLTPKQEAVKKAETAKAELDKASKEPLAALKKAAEAKDAAEKSVAALAPESKAAGEKLNQAKTAAAKASEAKNVAEKALAALPPTAKKPESDDLKAKADAAKAAFDKAAAAQAAEEKNAAAIADRVKAAEAARDAATKTFNDLTNQTKDIDTKIKTAEKTSADATLALKQADLAKTAAEQNHERCVGVMKRAQETLAAAKESATKADAGQKQADAALETAKKAAADSEKAIKTIAFSPDTKTLATAGDDKIIHTWGSELGKGGEQYEGQTEAIGAVAFLPDGRLVSAGKGKALVWSSAAEYKFARMIGSGDEKSPLSGRVLALNFSPDGKLLASGGGIPARAGELKLWNVADGALVREIKEAHSDTIFGLAFSRDSRYLASCAADKIVKVFDPASGKLVKIFEGHTNYVLSVAWKRDGRTLVSGGADKVAKLWSLVTGEQLKTIDGFKKEVTSVYFLDPQNEILISSGDGQVRSAKEDNNKVRAFQAGSDYIQSATATPDGKLVVAGGYDSTLRVFESNKDKVLQSFEAPK